MVVHLVRHSFFSPGCLFVLRSANTFLVLLRLAISDCNSLYVYLLPVVCRRAVKDHCSQEPIVRYMTLLHIVTFYTVLDKG